MEALMEKLSILDRLDRELLGKGDRRSSAKDPNDHNWPMPDSGDLGKLVVLESTGPSLEVSGGSVEVTIVGEVVKGAGGHMGGDLVSSDRGGLSEDAKWLDLTVRRLEMPMFDGWNLDGWIYSAEC